MKRIYFECNPNEDFVNVAIGEPDGIEYLGFTIPITKKKEDTLNFGKIAEFRIDVDSLLEKIKQFDK